MSLKTCTNYKLITPAARRAFSGAYFNKKLSLLCGETPAILPTLFTAVLDEQIHLIGVCV